MGAKHKLEHHKKHQMKTGGVNNNGKINKYNADNAPEVKEAENTKEGFGKGGVKHKKDGGHADGHKAKRRMDKMARGGAKKMAAGGSPFTAAHKRKPYLNKGEGDGHEGIGPDRDSEAD